MNFSPIFHDFLSPHICRQKMSPSSIPALFPANSMWKRMCCRSLLSHLTDPTPNRLPRRHDNAELLKRRTERMVFKLALKGRLLPTASPPPPVQTKRQGLHLLGSPGKSHEGLPPTSPTFPDPRLYSSPSLRGKEALLLGQPSKTRCKWQLALHASWRDVILLTVSCVSRCEQDFRQFVSRTSEQRCRRVHSTSWGNFRCADQTQVIKAVPWDDISNFASIRGSVAGVLC